MHRQFFTKVSISHLIIIVAASCPFLAFSLVHGIGFHDNQRIIEIFCVTMTAMVVTGYLLKNVFIRRPYNGPAICLSMLFFLLGLVSSVLSYSPRHALFEWANFQLLFGIACLIALEIAANGDAMLDHILRLCGWGCAFYIFIEIIIYVAVINIGNQPTNSVLIFGYDNYRFFNHVQTIALPLLGLLISSSNNSKQKLFAWGVTSVWWTLLFVSAGRGTFIGLLAGICATWFFLRKDALPWCRLMLQSALLGLGAYFLFYVFVPLALGLQPFGFLFSVVDRTMENPSSSRWQLWVRAWELIVAHPWLGVGPLHFAHFGRDVQIGAHPHNWILQIACEWGIPALLCLITVIALSFKKLLAVRQYLAPTDMKNHLTLAAWLTTGVAILVDGLVSGLIVMPTSQLWIALYIGCAWGWTVSMTPRQAEVAVRLSLPVRIGGVFGILALLYCLGNGLWPEIRNLPLYEEQNLQKDLYVNPLLRPRIWTGGYF